MIIAVDFDGTCVTHEYPNIGREIGAVPVLKALVSKGHQLILWTIRSGKTLEEASDWFKNNGIPLYGKNSNPTQSTWSKSPKCYAQIFIDDAALGCPLVEDKFKESVMDRPYVDWKKIEQVLRQKEIL